MAGLYGPIADRVAATWPGGGAPGPPLAEAAATARRYRPEKAAGDENFGCRQL